MHDHVLPGRCRLNTMVERGFRSLWWRRMHPLVGKYLLTCGEYQQETQRNTLRLNFIQSIPLLKWIWANISLDFIVGLPSLWDYDVTYAVVARLSTKNLASSSIRISLQQVEWRNCSFLTFGSSVVSREATQLRWS